MVDATAAAAAAVAFLASKKSSLRNSRLSCEFIALVLFLSLSRSVSFPLSIFLPLFLSVPLYVALTSVTNICAAAGAIMFARAQTQVPDVFLLFFFFNFTAAPIIYTR